MVRVKICGITRPEDAQLAESAGADAIGLMFVPESKRVVTLAQAREVVAALGPFVARVGVFRGQGLAQIVATLEAVSLSAVQVHEADAGLLAGLSLLGVPLLVAVSLRPHEAVVWPGVGTPMVDGPDPGSGVVGDWARLVGDGAPRGRWVLAGGLHVGNVGAAVRGLRPWAVDVSSGVEIAPGVKDGQKMRDFVRVAREASAP